MRTGLVYSPLFLRHDTGPGHPERPERLTAILNSLLESRLLDRLVPLSFEAADPDALATVHEPAYVELVRLACREGVPFVGDPETRVSADSYDVARRAAGGVVAACEAAMDGRVQAVFCAVRPPGHHAERDRAMGYCLFNHVAIAAEHLVRRHGLERVAIVDWDVHHGNGTQRIFEDRADVLYASIHQSPYRFYPDSGYAVERGHGPGLGLTINVPLRAGVAQAEYCDAFEREILPRVRAFAPQFLLVSAGFDAAAGDPTSHIDLAPECFAWMTRKLLEATGPPAGGRFVSVLEGGYEPACLGRCVAAHVRTLLDFLP